MTYVVKITDATGKEQTLHCLLGDSVLVTAGPKATPRAESHYDELMRLREECAKLRHDLRIQGERYRELEEENARLALLAHREAS